MYVRRARISDSDKLVELIKVMTKEHNNLKSRKKQNMPKIDLDVVKDEIFDTLVLGTSAIAGFVAAKEDDIVGFTLVYLDKSPYTGRKIGKKRFWFVHPEHRKGMTALKLFQKAMDWWHEKGVEYIKVGHWEGSKDVEAFYRKLGFKPEVKYYTMEVNN